MSFLHRHEGPTGTPEPTAASTGDPAHDPALGPPAGDEMADETAEPVREVEPAPTPRQGNMLPGRERRRSGIERLLVRAVATGGVIGIGVALGAILASSKVQGWIIGLVVATLSVILSAILWSSRQL
jgi:hypothetical protein